MRMYLLNPKKDMDKNIAEILDAYQKKMGVPPTIVEVHPSILKEVKIPDGMKVVVRSQKYVQPVLVYVGE